MCDRFPCIARSIISTSLTGHFRQAAYLIVCFIATRKILGFYSSVFNFSRWNVLKGGWDRCVPRILYACGLYVGCVYVVCTHDRGPSVLGTPDPPESHHQFTVWWCTSTNTDDVVIRWCQTRGDNDVHVQIRLMWSFVDVKHKHE